MTEQNEPTALELRQAEVDQYTKNIAIYSNILATLPTEWPEHLLQYKGATDPHGTIATVEDLEDVELLALLWQADNCKASIRTEMLERAKANSILIALQALDNS
jgi:hypothetical protein